MQLPWPTFRGPQTAQTGATHVVVPDNLSSALLWSWHHPAGRYHTVVAGGPVFDAAGCAYLTTSDGVRKFSPEGAVLWHAPQPDSRINNEISLLGDKVFGSDQNGIAFALSAETGVPVWRKKMADSSGGDAGYPAAYDGVFVVGAELGNDTANPGGGNQLVFGLDAASGAELWTFRPQRPVWNFSPLFPGDDSVVFMDFSGGMYRLRLHEGTLLWHVPSRGAIESFSDGGAALAPDGAAVYSCSNPGSSMGFEGTSGVLRALRVADGGPLWEQVLPQPCNSYPAVGPLGFAGRLSVAVTPGSFMGGSNLHGSIMTFDAATGAPQWRFNAKAYTGPLGAAKGDMEGALERMLFDPFHVACIPAHWSAANIDGDGFVYAARSDGLIYGVRGPTIVGPPAEFEKATTVASLGPAFASTPGLEVRTFNVDGASLHGAFGFAPGRVGVATCDTLYVFRA